MASLQDQFWHSLVRNHACASSLALLIYEYFHTLDDEVTLIWGWSMSAVQWMFVYCRYSAIILQMVNMPLFLALRLEHPLSRQQCIIWSTFATFMIQSLWFVVEAVQLIKVRAFYSEYPKCLRCLQIFRIVAFAIATYSSVSVVSYLVYDGACNVVEMPRQASYFASTSLLTQAIILPLMLSAKTVKEDWKHSSLIATTSRDSLLVFAVITVISAMLIAHADDLSHIIPSYLLAGLSVCGCRMILNTLSELQRANANKNAKFCSSYNFTTFIGGLCVDEEVAGNQTT